MEMNSLSGRNADVYIFHLIFKLNFSEERKKCQRIICPGMERDDKRAAPTNGAAPATRLVHSVQQL